MAATATGTNNTAPVQIHSYPVNRVPAHPGEFGNLSVELGSVGHIYFL
jgi:hypothetical protein